MHTKEQVLEEVARSLQKKDLSQQAAGVIQRCSEKVLRRLQQDTDASLKESADDTALDFSQKLSEKLGILSQNWIDNNKQELLIYPEGTRFIQKEGELTIIVVEQPPQVRTVVIDKLRRHLAMPYVVFMLVFNGRNWRELCVGFRSKPLESMNDYLKTVPLPNMQGNHRVCMGDFKPDFSKNKTQQTSQVIAEFWQSEFAGARNYGSLDFALWEAMTHKDSLFILKENFSDGKRLIDLISECVKNKKNIDIVAALKEEIITAVGEVGLNIKQTMLNIDLIKQNKEKVAIETLDEILREIIKQAYKELWDYLKACMDKERVSLQKEYMALLDKKKKVWDYE